jgi:hypothetical protein
MSTRYVGGLITKTPPTLNPALGNAANGVFTMSQYMQAVKNATWPGFDPYFNQTVLLLHGDGTNGAQNNTFLDGSTNNFTITRNGNTTQGTFSPFSVGAGEWSNFFDGTGDYLNVADNAAFTMGSGDFTIEAWVYKTSTDRGYIVGQSDGVSLAATSFALQVNASNKLVSAVAVSSTEYAATSTADFPLNQWVHVAMVRNGGNLSQYINGTKDGENTGLSTNSINDSSIIVSVGALGNLNSLRWFGYISNARIVKGRAVYTSNFTPSTTPLGAISGGTNPPQGTETSLLTCQSNRFVDNGTANSGTGFAITRNGDVRVTPFSPFAPSAAYDPAVNGGSGYFDGSGDYLSLAASAQFLPGANTDFSFEAWVYLTATPGATTAQIVGTGEYGTNSDWNISVDSSRQPFFYINTAAPGTLITSSVAINVGEWNHIVATRSGTSTNNLKLFVNGVNVGQTSTNVTLDYNGNNLTLGADENGDESNLTGYISGLRLLNGTGYTSITVPTAPPTAITNTSLLCNFTNAGIFDNTGKNNLETVGDAQIDTTTKKYGTGSMEFDGTGDWLLMANTPDQQLGTGNFTIEFWVYLATGDIGSNRGLVAKGGASTGFLVSLNTTEKVVFTFTSSTITSTGAITTNAWNHIAVVREGTGSNLTKIYINGTNDGTGTVSTDFNQTEVMYVGCNRAAGDPMKGFIDDLRITKGIARYTANFTAQTSQWQDQ